MKTKEELDELKNEIDALRAKCEELTDEELEQVTGGMKAIKLAYASKEVVAGAVDRFLLLDQLQIACNAERKAVVVHDVAVNRVAENLEK